MTATACYQVPNVRLETLRTKVARMARRCSKLGLAPLALIEHKASLRSKMVFCKGRAWVRHSTGPDRLPGLHVVRAHGRVA